MDCGVIEGCGMLECIVFGKKVSGVGSGIGEGPCVANGNM